MDSEDESGIPSAALRVAQQWYNQTTWPEIVVHESGIVARALGSLPTAYLSTLSQLPQALSIASSISCIA